MNNRIVLTFFVCLGVITHASAMTKRASSGVWSPVCSRPQTPLSPSDQLLAGSQGPTEVVRVVLDFAPVRCPECRDCVKFGKEQELEQAEHLLTQASKCAYRSVDSEAWAYVAVYKREVKRLRKEYDTMTARFFGK